jgi:hypothetical protein
MGRRGSIYAIVLGVLAVVAAARQMGVPSSLSGTLRDHVKDERFDLVSSIRGLPLGVREELQNLFGGQSLDIAESGAALQDSDTAVDSTLRLRRLVAAGCSADHCLVYYERGGSTHTWLAALFHWTPEATRLEWAGNASGGMTTIDDVRNAVVAGSIKGPVKLW